MNFLRQGIQVIPRILFDVSLSWASGKWYAHCVVSMVNWVVWWDSCFETSEHDESWLVSDMAYLSRSFWKKKMFLMEFMIQNQMNRNGGGNSQVSWCIWGEIWVGPRKC